MPRFSCYVIGDDSLLIECAELLLAGGHDVRGVVSDSPRIGAWADRRGLRRWPVAGYEPALAGEAPFDYLFAITHLALVPAAVLRLPGRGAINFHDGPLPRYAGLNAPAWALMAREPRYGVSWHLMAPGVDEGDVLVQRVFDVASDETSLGLNTRCFAAGLESFRELIDALAAGTVTRRTQDRAGRTYFARHDRPAAACVLDFSKPAATLDALVRALDFGPYDNPLGVARLVHRGRAFRVLGTSVDHRAPAAPAGRVLALGVEGARVATADGVLVLRTMATLDGQPVDVPTAFDRLSVRAGDDLDVLSPTLADRLTAMGARLARSESFFLKRLASLDPIHIPYAGVSPSAARDAFDLAVPDGLATTVALPSADAVTLVVAAFLGRLADAATFDVAFADEALTAIGRDLPPLTATSVPLRVGLGAGDASLPAIAPAFREELDRVRRAGTYWIDAPSRRSERAGRTQIGQPIAMPVAVVQTTARPVPAEAAVVFAIDPAGTTIRVSYDTGVMGEREARALRRQLQHFIDRVAAAPDTRLADLDLLSPDERQSVVVEWNRTAAPYPTDACVHALIEQQARRTPDAPAVTFEDTTLSYREIDERSNRLAAYLRDAGVRPDQLVGVCLDRSIDLVVAVIAVHKAGGAYVPLDPTYPRERLALMLEDSGAPIVVSNRRLAADLPATRTRVIRLDADNAAIAAQSSEALPPSARATDLAYVIYTSGSTGRPKGVMVEHRNVVNFFTGMDPVIAHDPPGTWLAVTSLSFDISVLELLWTLARGFHVVVHEDRDRARPASVADPRPASAVRRPPDFSVFLWGSEDTVSANKYRLMLESARFADDHSFVAVWTPERHFHAFGGPYPNPSVTGAAIAACTTRVQVRAGSCVMPLHHPVRVAEEWAVIDNLTNGRAGISFASGWQPDDFLLRPENYADRNSAMLAGIDMVRRLWRGEKVTFPGAIGRDVEVATQPRPIQRELPFWITTAGNPETYRTAGALGANVLTHLLGQSLEEVAQKIAIYRDARAAAGHDPSTGIVSLMLHTFVGESVDRVREIVRQPMKEYLRSSVSLIKGFAWTFPAFKRPAGTNATPNDIDLGSLTAEELDAILEFAFERYFETSGLFGTPESCQAMIARCQDAGVDEIACLIDFGVPADVAAGALAGLARARDLARSAASEAAVTATRGDFSIASEIARHRVTHLQCTPSMARMLLTDDRTRHALGSLAHVFIGGEAFPPSLARDLAAAMPAATVTNMYGPTETTIWSSTFAVTAPASTVPIGRPIANTQLYVLDRERRPVPAGVPGELYIGGDGVTRGYLGRPELTAERFVGDPFTGGGARMYRTGDLARFQDDGVVEFLGRADFQVKVRGHRIELGEIEAALARHPGVGDAVVVAREDTPGDQRLVAYIVSRGAGAEPEALRTWLRETLPEYMVPSHIVRLDAFPLTPNGKVDRQRLPAPDAADVRPRTAFVAPGSALEETMATAWRETLGVDHVGVHDNFFDLGGHSLLVVRLHRQLAPAMPKPLSLTDLYRFPTIALLSGYLTADRTSGAVAESTDRARLRRERLERRRHGRTG